MTEPVTVVPVYTCLVGLEGGRCGLLWSDLEADAVVDPDRFNENTDMDFVLDVGERLIERFPAMEESETAKGYASLYGITPDWHPIIDELIPGSGFYISAGFSQRCANARQFCVKTRRHSGRFA